MAFDTFLSIETVTGEATQANHRAGSRSTRSPGGPPIPRPSAPAAPVWRRARLGLELQRHEEDRDLVVHAVRRLLRGQHFPTATVEMSKATGTTGQQQVYLKYEFTDVMVESVQWSGSTGGDDTPTNLSALPSPKSPSPTPSKTKRTVP